MKYLWTGFGLGCACWGAALVFGKLSMMLGIFANFGALTWGAVGIGAGSFLTVLCADSLGGTPAKKKR